MSAGIGEKREAPSFFVLSARVVPTHTHTYLHVHTGTQKSGPDASGDKMTRVCIVIRDNGGATRIADGRRGWV